MKEELEAIGKKLKKWCVKYNKNYVNMAFVNGSVIANVDAEDKNYEELEIYIKGDEE